VSVNKTPLLFSLFKAMTPFVRPRRAAYRSPTMKCPHLLAGRPWRSFNCCQVISAIFALPVLSFLFLSPFFFNPRRLAVKATRRGFGWSLLRHPYFFSRVRTLLFTADSPLFPLFSFSPFFPLHPLTPSYPIHLGLRPVRLSGGPAPSPSPLRTVSPTYIQARTLLGDPILASSICEPRKRCISFFFPSFFLVSQPLTLAIKAGTTDELCGLSS